MDFGSGGNRVPNCRSWDFLLFPSRDWCAWIVLSCTRVHNRAHELVEQLKSIGEHCDLDFICGLMIV